MIHKGMAVICRTAEEQEMFINAAKQVGFRYMDGTDLIKSCIPIRYSINIKNSNDCISECDDLNYTLKYGIKEVCEASKLFNMNTVCIQTEPDKDTLIEAKKETKTMKKNLLCNMTSKLMEQFMPQKIEGDEVGLSFSGAVVVKRADGDYVRYDSEKKQIVNEMQLAMAGDGISKMIFLMPTTEVKTGDVIKNNNTYHYITDIAQDGKLVTMSLNSGRKSSLVDECNAIFGKKMYKKVTSLFTMGTDTTTNPMLLAALMAEDNENDMFQLIAISQMMGGQQANPMMMALMLSGEDSSSKDMISIMLMSQMFGGANPFVQTQK